MSNYHYLKDKIKQEIDLMDFISSVIEVNSQGKAICPFHEGDTDPSLSIKDQYWHCFGCGRGGDIFNFVMNYYHLNFIQSIQFLASKYGFEVKNEPSPYYKVMNQLQKKFLSYQDIAIDILNSRKIKSKIASNFRIGYVKEFNFDGIDIDFLRELNLVYDDFIYSNPKFIVKNSLTLPIFSSANSVVGFVFKPSDGKPKYRSISNNSYFSKSNYLYGYYQALPYIKESNSVILVEGFFDVFRLSQMGYKNVVGILGSSFSKKQIDLLKPYVDEVFILMDGDKAGRESSIKVSLKLYSEKIDNLIIALPEGEDPDSYFKANNQFPSRRNWYKDPIDFYHKFFDVSNLSWLLKLLSEVYNIEFFNYCIKSLSMKYPKIPDNLILSTIFSKNKRIHNLGTSNEPIFKEIMKYLIIGDLTLPQLTKKLEQILRDKYKEVFKVYDKYGYFNINFIDDESLIGEEPLIEIDKVLEYLEFVNYLDNEDLNEIIKYKRRLKNA